MRAGRGKPGHRWQRQETPMPRIAASGEWPKSCKIPPGLRTKIMQHARGLARACIMADTDLSYKDADNLRVRVTLPDYTRKARKRRKAK